MTFTLHGFPLLRVNTLNLDTIFSTHLGRYKIVDTSSGAGPASAGPIAVQSSLELLIARTNIVAQCKTDRETQRAVFVQLQNELREVLAENDDTKNQQGTLFLLGALLHRYFRIIKEYSSSIAAIGLFNSDPKNSGLFLAIREALLLPDELPKGYKEKDLSILDPVTVVTALEVFRDNMLLPDEIGEPRYMRYPHFKADPHFEVYLQDIINEHQARGEKILKQFEAIHFLNSLTAQLEEDRKQIEEILDAWNRGLAMDYPDFSLISKEQLKIHLEQSIEPGRLRGQIAELLTTSAIDAVLTRRNRALFIDEMKKCNSDISSYSLFGAFAMFLQSKSIDDRLKFCLNQALGIERNPEVLEATDLLNGITFLHTYLDNNPEAKLDYTYFGNRDQLITRLVQKEYQFTEAERRTPMAV